MQALKRDVGWLLKLWCWHSNGKYFLMKCKYVFYFSFKNYIGCDHSFKDFCFCLRQFDYGNRRQIRQWYGLSRALEHKVWTTKRIEGKKKLSFSAGTKNAMFHRLCRIKSRIKRYSRFRYFFFHSIWSGLILWKCRHIFLILIPLLLIFFCQAHLVLGCGSMTCALHIHSPIGVIWACVHTRFKR